VILVPNDRVSKSEFGHEEVKEAVSLPCRSAVSGACIAPRSASGRSPSRLTAETPLHWITIPTRAAP